MAPDQTLELCEELIRSGSINARIDWSTEEAVLRFLDVDAPEAGLFQKLTAQIERTSKISDFVKLSDSKITLSKDFVKAVRRAKEDGENAQRGEAAALGDGVDDENLMDETIGMDEV
jgi:hypothetical protein